MRPFSKLIEVHGLEFGFIGEGVAELIPLRTGHGRVLGVDKLMQP